MKSIATAITALFLATGIGIAQEVKILPVTGEVVGWKANGEYGKNDAGQLTVTLSGNEFSAVGINWANWWKKSPKVVDSTTCKNFIIKFKIAEGATNLPALGLAFGDIAKGKSKVVKIGKKYAEQIKIGHEVELTIPMAEFTQEAPALKDPKLWVLTVSAPKTAQATNIRMTLIEARFTRE